MNKNIKRFLSIDKIYSNYEATSNFRKIFGVTRKAKVGSLIPGKKDKKTKKVVGDTIKEVLKVFIPAANAIS